MTLANLGRLVVGDKVNYYYYDQLETYHRSSEFTVKENGTIWIDYPQHNEGLKAFVNDKLVVDMPPDRIDWFLP